jgi:hypothetical protein
MDHDDAQGAPGALARIEAVWRLEPAAPSPPPLSGTLTVKALDMIGPRPSAAAVARARFELELLHDGDALDDAECARELQALDGLEGPGA